MLLPNVAKHGSYMNRFIYLPYLANNVVTKFNCAKHGSYVNRFIYLPKLASNVVTKLCQTW